MKKRRATKAAIVEEAEEGDEDEPSEHDSELSGDDDNEDGEDDDEEYDVDVDRETADDVVIEAIIDEVQKTHKLSDKEERTSRFAVTKVSVIPYIISFYLRC